MQGTYDRDGEEAGRFWMWRSGVPGSTGDPGARPDGIPVMGGAAGAASLEIVALQELIDAAGGRDDQRQEIRDAIRDQVERSFRDRGQGSRAVREEIETLTLEIERRAVVEGVPLVEVIQILDPASPGKADGSLEAQPR
jgi:hypothetical protein